MLIPGGICEQFPLRSPSSWSCMGCCDVAPGLVFILCAHPNDTSEKFAFHVKGGLVTEFFFGACLNDGLGSFLGWSIFIFSPSPHGSTWEVIFAMIVAGGTCEQFPFYPLSSWSCMGCCGVAPSLVLAPSLILGSFVGWLILIYSPSSLNSTQAVMLAMLVLVPQSPFHVKGGLVIELFSWVFLKNGLGSFVGWPIFIFSPSSLGSTWLVKLSMLILGGICEQFPFCSPSSWSCVDCCGVALGLVLIPHPHPNDTSDRFSFKWKVGW